MREENPRKGEHLWSRARYDEHKIPNGVITRIDYDGEECVVVYAGGDVGFFTFDELAGNEKELAGQKWWIIGDEPSPAEVEERMKTS